MIGYSQQILLAPLKIITTSVGLSDILIYKINRFPPGGHLYCALRIYGRYFLDHNLQIYLNYIHPGQAQILHIYIHITSGGENGKKVDGKTTDGLVLDREKQLVLPEGDKD